MKKKAFTMIELLVIIVIIGTLSAIAIPQFTSHNRAARDAGRQVSLDGMSVVFLTGRAGGEGFPYDKISDGILTTTLTDLQNTLDLKGQKIPKPSGGRSFWYFSQGNNIIVAVCSEADVGKAYAKGTNALGSEVECITNNKVPRPVSGGIFDGGTNLEMLP